MKKYRIEYFKVEQVEETDSSEKKREILDIENGYNATKGRDRKTLLIFYKIYNIIYL